MPGHSRQEEGVGNKVIAPPSAFKRAAPSSTTPKVAKKLRFASLPIEEDGGLGDVPERHQGGGARDTAAEGVEGVSGEDQGTTSLPIRRRLKRCRAAEVIHLCMVDDKESARKLLRECRSSGCSSSSSSSSRSATESEGAGNSGWFSPEFTHQLFPREKIVGYSHDMITIKVLYGSCSLACLVSVECKTCGDGGGEVEHHYREGEEEELGEEEEDDDSEQEGEEEDDDTRARGPAAVGDTAVGAEAGAQGRVERLEEKPMTPSVICGLLAKCLPPGWTTSEDEFCRQLQSEQQGVEGEGGEAEGRQGAGTGVFNRSFRPCGERSFSYTARSSSSSPFGTESEFEVWRATAREHKGAKEYHDRVQGLALFFIETADFVDIDDDRWEVFYLFKVTRTGTLNASSSSGGGGGGGGGGGEPAYTLAGYFTVFNFRNPIKGVSMRICQALVLPPFQRQGHGRELIRHISGLARAREAVFQITVEDPAPAFVHLRDATDVEECFSAGVFPSDALLLLRPVPPTPPPKSLTSLNSSSTGTGSAIPLRGLSSAEVEGVETRLKLVTAQVHCAYELLQLLGISRRQAAAAVARGGASEGGEGDCSIPHCDGIVVDNKQHRQDQQQQQEQEEEEDEETSAQWKQFRLMVKRRLVKEHKEVLSTDKTARKQQLEELYQDLMSSRYRPALKRLGRSVPLTMQEE